MTSFGEAVSTVSLHQVNHFSFPALSASGHIRLCLLLAG
jgi:hypothetical protein